jgi:asparagine synthase (glutamine-hydrolysing)
MCGICGIVGFDGKAASRTDLERMNAALAHRGPDGEGVFLRGPVGLGHRRLSILDLTETGHQPMAYADERFWISYNGEVYNFVEVRAELEAKGVRFRGESDTEVVLAAYAEWGIAALRRFNGMWAFAIWDDTRRELFLARDRFGVKPLFFFHNRRRLAFASEIKALIELEDCPRSANLRLIRDGLFGYSLDRGRETVLDGVLRLEPGHWLKVTADGTLHGERWWETWGERVAVPSDDREQVDEFRRRFDEACRLRQRSDVPVCTLLSGGVDSSSIACTIAAMHSGSQAADLGARIAGDWQQSFTSSLAGSVLDETDYAQTVADACGMRSNLVSGDASDLIGQVAAASATLDTPVVSSMPSVSAVYGAVHDAGLKVTLDGQGADELLSGYTANDAVRHFALHGQFSRSWQAAQSTALVRWPNVTPGRVVRDEAVMMARSVLPVRTLLRKLPGVSEAPLSVIPGVPGPALPALLRHPQPAAAPAGADAVTGRLYWEFHDTILPQILRHYDHMAMHWSVESRMPFLDWRLVTYAFSLPVEQKVGDGYTKLILRRAMAGRVPEKVLQRRTKFGFPIAPEWFDRADVRNAAREVIADRSFECSGFWDAAAVRRWFDGRSETPWTYYDSSLLVRFLSTQFWYERYVG